MHPQLLRTIPINKMFIDYHKLSEISELLLIIEFTLSNGANSYCDRRFILESTRSRDPKSFHTSDEHTKYGPLNLPFLSFPEITQQAQSHVSEGISGILSHKDLRVVF